ncbi:MAG: ABC transporter permease [Candidatus Aureabacteria bacterium]|nr:ABC transporter permease [Candidatus Auribacterota bacterium]
MNFVSFRIAQRYLLTKRKERFISVITFFSIGGVALSVMVLIVVIAVMTGFERDLKEKIIGVNAHLTIEGQGIVDNYADVIKKVGKTPEVISATPFVHGQILVGIGNSITGVLLRGINIEDEKKVSLLSKYIRNKNLKWESDSILIGKEFSKKFQLYPGDKVEIILPITGVKSKLGFLKNRMVFEVSGIFDSGMYEYDANLLFIPLSTAQKIYVLGDGVHGISVRIEDIARANTVKRNLNEILLPMGLRAKSWADRNRRLFAALKTEKSVMFIVLAMAVAVAATNIISTLIMMVMEKTKDVGILKAIGLSSTGVLSIFLLEGIFIGVIGTFIGVTAAFIFLKYLDLIQGALERFAGFEVFPREIYYFESIPRFMDIGDVSIIAGAAMLITVLAAVYPAFKAAMLNPIEALRYE